MEETNIRKYAKLMQELDLTGLEISENGSMMRLERGGSAPAPTVVTATPYPPSAETISLPSLSDEPGVVSVLSPMVGVYYASPTEAQSPYVSVGDTVRKGDVLCIIEAMKLMNEIVSDYDGTIVEICVGNQQVVDYGHPLFRIRKEGP